MTACSRRDFPAPAAQTPKSPQRPKLVVLLVVDQMRGDYVDKFRGQWTGGLKRLVEEGAWFREAAYPYAATETCVGHATISTGAFPATHGMVANAWWDRETQKMVTCTADPNAKNSGYAGATAKGGDSAWRMLIPAFAEELKFQTGGADPRGDVLAESARRHHHGRPQGRRRDVVRQRRGVDDLERLRHHAVCRGLRQGASREGRLRQNVDISRCRKSPTGTTRRPPARSASRLGADISPCAARKRRQRRAGRRILRAMGEQSVRGHLSDAAGGDRGRSTRLSVTAGRPIILASSYSSVDYVGHEFGPRSREIQDILMRLDKDLGELFAHLDQKSRPRKLRRGPQRRSRRGAHSRGHGHRPAPMPACCTCAELQEKIEKVARTI